MKKRIFLYGVMLLLLFTICPTVYAEEEWEMTLPPLTIETGDYQKLMEVGSQQQLAPVFTSSTPEQIPAFTSGDMTIATVSEKGLVNALTPGLVTISATLEEVETLYTISVFSPRMVVGTTQQLYCPIAGVDYISSDQTIVKVNATTGIVTALSAGTVEITATDGNETFTYSIESYVPLSDIDVGDYLNEMTVGTSQVLSPAVIPVDATENIFTFASDNNDILTVNALGRVTAIKEGTAHISISCGEVVRYCTIDVLEKEDTNVAVTDLDVGEYESTLEVGKSLSLTVTVLPTNATETQVQYSSSDETIATVNGNGRVNGIAVGSVTITASCGDVRKKIPIKVIVKTTGITVDSTYLVMKPGETHHISAMVSPTTAVQELNYQVLDKKVASVSESGIITAHSTGSTTVMVSNGEQQAVITIIVNKNTASLSAATDKEPEVIVESDPNKLVQQIKSGTEGQEFWLKENNMSEICSDILNALYGTKKVLRVAGDRYIIQITGKDIKNVNNSLSGKILFTLCDEGIEFTINNDKNLPGKILIELNEDFDKYNYLYLYNQSLNKWQFLNRYEENTLTIDGAGRYLLCEKKLNTITVYWYVIAGASVVVIGCFGVYVCLKKRYWFW